MVNYKTVFRHWQEMLAPYQSCFTTPGWFRFVEWVSGMALCQNEHWLTQTLVSIGKEGDWMALFKFAERGAWQKERIEQTLTHQVVQAQKEQFCDYLVWSVDDLKVHRQSKKVWGVGTFFEHTARCPNRASTVRAHNVVLMGALVWGKPWWFLPVGFRLYFRREQLPKGELFFSKPNLAVGLLDGAAKKVGGKNLAVFDGAYAVKSVVRPLSQRKGDEPKIKFLCRLREDARLYELPPPKDGGQRGRPRKWGVSLPAPNKADQWQGHWQEGKAFICGRQRELRFKEKLCLWAVCGSEVKVKVVVAEVEGMKKRWYLVSSALDLKGEQMAEVYAARFRQEDGHRDLKQRLGLKECRAWSKEAILRTIQVQVVCMSLMRLLQFELQKSQQRWWTVMPWYERKGHPSVWDVQKLLWGGRHIFEQLLPTLGEVTKNLMAHRSHAFLKGSNVNTGHVR